MRYEPSLLLGLVHLDYQVPVALVAVLDDVTGPESSLVEQVLQQRLGGFEFGVEDPDPFFG
jgi:hypothetical protein